MECAFYDREQSRTRGPSGARPFIWDDSMDATDLGLIAGCLGGGIGGGVGLFLALRALGFFQYLGGKKSSPLAVSKEILMEELLALNHDSRPYRITRGEDTD